MCWLELGLRGLAICILDLEKWRYIKREDRPDSSVLQLPALKANHMSGEDNFDVAPFYVLNIKYVFEGILTPTIGLIGIIGI